MSDVLKPCPFCRGEARWLEEPDELDAPFGLVVDHTENCFLGGRMMAEWDQICAAWDTRPAPDGEVVAYRYVYHDYAGRKVSRYGVHAERYNGRDPIEVHPLYTHPPRNDDVVEALRATAEAAATHLKDKMQMREALTLALDLIQGTHEYDPSHPVVSKLICALKQGEA